MKQANYVATLSAKNYINEQSKELIIDRSKIRRELDKT